MNVCFELHGVLQRLGGGPTLRIEVAPSATIGDALESLAASHPSLRAELPRCAIARGDVIVARREPLVADSTLALLPPVAGG